MYKYVSEIFDEMGQAENKEKKKAILEKYRNHKELMMILRMNYDDRMVFFTKKAPPYKEDIFPIGTQFESLVKVAKRLYIFIEGNEEVKRLSFQRKEHLLIQILEGLHKDEARIFLNAMLKRLKIRGVDRAMICEVWKDMLPPEKPLSEKMTDMVNNILPNILPKEDSPKTFHINNPEIEVVVGENSSSYTAKTVTETKPTEKKRGRPKKHGN